MPINFIAVQCFQCSTMQVRQEKKSSNKWICVVCGEKQSLRQVFAQGFLAKDVRGFVQKFNMSRSQLEEEKTFSDSLPRSEVENERKRRTDWTEYVDDETEDCLGKLDVENEDSELEAMVVTEIPKEVFKKPKLKRSSVSGSKFANTFGSQFNEFQKTGPIRNEQTMKKQKATSDEEYVELHNAGRDFKWNSLRAKMQKVNNESSANSDSWTSQSTNSTNNAKGSVSKWDVYSTGDENEAPSRSLHQVTAAKGPASKWSCFLTEDDYDEVQISGKEGSSNRASYMKSDAKQSLINYEKVEDDIHPDFL